MENDTFVNTSLTNWKKAQDLFTEHEKTFSHKASVLTQHSFKAGAAPVTVVDQLNAA